LNPVNCCTLEDARAWLRLTLTPGVRPRDHRALLKAFGSPQQALASSHAALAEACGEAAAAALAKGADAAMVEAALQWLARDGHLLVTLADSAYPQALLNIEEPPTVLYARGRVELLNEKCFAIVGSRNATRLGARDAEAFAATLAQSGWCVVSGLAAGHRCRGASRSAFLPRTEHRGDGHGRRHHLSGEQPQARRSPGRGRLPGLGIPARHAAGGAELPAPQPSDQWPVERRARGRGGIAQRLAHHRAHGREPGPRCVRRSRVHPFTAVQGLP
jgi:hypothetical protein